MSSTAGYQGDSHIKKQRPTCHVPDLDCPCLLAFLYGQDDTRSD